MHLLWTSVCTVCINSPNFSYFTFPKSILGGSETWEFKGQALWESFIIQVLGITFLVFHISKLWFMFGILLFLLACSSSFLPSGNTHFLIKPFLKCLAHTSYLSAMDEWLYALQNVPFNLQKLSLKISPCLQSSQSRLHCLQSFNQFILSPFCD